MSNVKRMPLPETTAEDTSPRAALLDALREIDECGFEPTGILIMAVQETEETDKSVSFSDHWWMAGPTMATFSRSVGWLECLKAKMLRGIIGTER